MDLWPVPLAETSLPGMLFAMVLLFGLPLVAWR
jgi:hypothetical protein